VRVDITDLCRPCVNIQSWRKVYFSPQVILQNLTEIFKEGRRKNQKGENKK
jgi:hypothetical protein